MSGLHFCMVTTFYPPYSFGGDGIAVQRLSRALVRRGHRVTVIHDVDAFHALSPGPAPESRGEDDGVHVIGLRSRLGAVSTVLTQQTGRPVVHRLTIDRILKRESPDVIHFHNISLIGGPGILSQGEGLKVYTAHEHWLVCPSHVLWRHGRELCTGRECTRCVLNQGRPPQYWRYTGFLERQLRHVDLFIAASQFSREKHREFGFSRPMEVLPHFLPGPSESDVPVDTDAPHGRPHFLFAGRLELIKGLDDVIPVLQRYEDADLLIAGDGTHTPVLQKLAAGNPRVRFLGRVSQAELSHQYRHAIATIVPSVCYETFGLVLIESFRHSTPVIARRIGALPEAVEHSGGGLLFDTPEELEAAMTRLQRDADARQRFSRAAGGSFWKYWSEEAVVPRYLELIRRVAEKRGERRIVQAIIDPAVGGKSRIGCGAVEVYPTA
jgi:glycosyltransferase involved in cell wall biosynthesis